MIPLGVLGSSVAASTAAAPASVVDTTNSSTREYTTSHAVTLATTPDAGDVVIVASLYSPADSCSGLGATWTSIAPAGAYGDIWMGVGATSSGDITISRSSAAYLYAVVWLVRGCASTDIAANYGTSDTGSVSAGPGSFVLATGRSNSSSAPVGTPTPSSDWSANSYTPYFSVRLATLERSPSSAETHSVAFTNCYTDAAIIVRVGPAS